MWTGDDSCDLGEITNVSELIARGTEISRSFGSSRFAYLLLRAPHSKLVAGAYIVTDYPDEWVSRYVVRNFRFLDPVAKTYRRARLPFFWGDDESFAHMSKAQRAMMHEARAFGLVEGYATPTAGPEGDLGGVCLSVDTRHGAEEMVAESVARIQLFAARFHAAAVRLLLDQAETPAVNLTRRELEVLSWAAEGYSSEATADRMGLTAPTVNYHIANCGRKLGARNKIQAVALAVRQRLI
ncbi:LuxR family transcriptional regulator [uncultured Roseibium sp.]|uniref:helix-turn-helix transcriptional regulator n=1 Tax=uncultured Roseibium sp. TaxID=1936171 RepID=UPI0032162E0D